jgi:translation initiation factor IF-3
VPPLIKPVANGDITFPEVRVIDADGRTNLGVLPLADALRAAAAKQLDLVVFAPAASPPVCRIVSLAELLRQRGKEQEEAEEEAKAAARERKVKEVRLTARTDAHDLGVKAGKVIDFLRQGSAVKVSVSFTLSAWLREEPDRRDVFAQVVRRVAEAGVGFCDASGLAGQGPVLSGLFTPVNAPRAAADWERTLTRLASPLRPATDDERMRKVAATAAAAAGGTAKAATVESLLPPTEQLLKTYRSPKPLLAGAEGGPGGADIKQREVDALVEDADVVAPAAPRRKRVE